MRPHSGGRPARAAQSTTTIGAARRLPRQHAAAAPASNVEHAPLQALARRSRVMASACSGAVLLAGAGLLAGRRITTWWLADWFRQRFAGVDVALDRVLMADGDRWTAAAGAAYMHLGLELVHELSVEAIAAGTARLMLVERRRGSQSPFWRSAAAARGRGSAHAERAALPGRAHGHAPHHHGAVSRDRRARAHAGAPGPGDHRSVAAQLLAVASSRVRQLLESSALPFDEIVFQCGYEDVASFRSCSLDRSG